MEQRQLRTGFTTGTCASAAAKAAAIFLLQGTCQEEAVAVSMPGGTTSLWHPVPQDAAGDLAGYWGVKKDAGDDPDVTDGAWVCAAVVQVDEREFRRLCREGQGYASREFPGLYLNGGRGIGIVTKPGLACPPGHYAINPVPRTMILTAVQEALEDCKDHERPEYLEIRLAVPGGERLGEGTFNPRLGIVGGISILGTTGLVKPMSEDALLATIRLDIRTRLLENGKDQAGLLVMAPGNYGTAWLGETLGVGEDRIVKCSNFVRAAVEMAVEEGGKHLLFTGHLGKLVKVAGGVENTHSRYGDRRMEILEGLVQACLEEAEVPACREKEPDGSRQKPARQPWLPGCQNGAGGAAPDMTEAGKRQLLEAVRQASTTDGAMELLDAHGLAAPVLTRMAWQVKRQMEAWGKGVLAVEVIVFSSVGDLSGRTSQAEKLLSERRDT